MITESRERKNRLEQEMVVGMGEEQERLIRMEMQRKQDELKVWLYSIFFIENFSFFSLLEDSLMYPNSDTVSNSGVGVNRNLFRFQKISIP